MSALRARRPIASLAILALIGGAAFAATMLLDRPHTPAPAHGGLAFVRALRGDRATVWAVGDGDGGVAARAISARIAAGHPDRFLYLGDVYENGTADDFTHNYADAYGKMARITAPTPGNHDWPNHATGYDPYWQRALHRRAAAWYAFRAGDWTLLSLDSEAPHTTGSPQYRWLRAQLRRPGSCRIAFWHRPRFSAGTSHGDQPDMAPLWDALRGHAAIALAGHEHDMQRFKPIAGITEFVSGAGDHSLYPIRNDDPRLAFANDSSYGALRLKLSRGLASYAFVAAAGRILDHGSLRCRPSSTLIPKQ